jgi:TLC domain
MGYNDKMISIHHVLACMLESAVLYKGTASSEMMQAFWQGETSNPFLSIHDVLKENGYDEKKLRPLQYMFGFTFLFLRLVTVPSSLKTIFSTNVFVFLKIVTATLCKFDLL